MNRTNSFTTPMYITPRLFILGIKCFYEKNNDKHITVNTKNWHRYWSDYGWSKMDDIWIKRLNSFCERKPKNHLFGVLDCGSNGDCLFHCVAQALNGNYDTPVWSPEDIRTTVSKQINKYNFDNIIETYKIQQECNEFEGLWDPKKVKSVREFRNIIKTMGNTFWGDHITIQLIEEAYSINIILMKKYSEDFYSKKEIKENNKIYPLGSELKKDRKTIILCYEDEIHFTLVGYFNDTIVQSLFKWEDIPYELLAVYNNDTSADYSR